MIKASRLAEKHDSVLACVKTLVAFATLENVIAYEAEARSNSGTRSGLMALAAKATAAAVLLIVVANVAGENKDESKEDTVRT